MDKINMRRRGLLAGTAAALSIPVFACAQGGKTVRMLVGFPPGQATDSVARLLAEQLRARTGGIHLVENRPGAGGSIALAQLAASVADGSVMMLAHMSALATAPFVYRNVRYDPLTDFEAVGLVGDLPFVLVCNPALPVRNVAQLVQYARAHPGVLTNASSGHGTVSHLAMEAFKRQAGVQILHVPYKGSAAGLSDVVAGNVSLALETASAVQPLVRDGRLRALACGTRERLGGALAVPTMAEQGYPDFNAATWLMLLYPKGTPQAVVQVAFGQVRRIVQDSGVDRKLRAMGLVPRTSDSPKEAGDYLAAEYRRWGEIVRQAAPATG